MREVPGTATSQVDEIEDANAFALLRGWHTIHVTGTDARAWLHDLVTTDVESLANGRTRRSLLLSPTGRIRADFHVAAVNGSFLLLQAPDQPEPVDAILAPYVLSSDVRLEVRADRSVVVACLGEAAAATSAAGDADGALVLRPSVLGPGRDLVVSRGAPAARALERLREAGWTEIAEEDLEARRIRRGVVRMGTDFGSDALPSEAGLEDTIDLSKGCFLGQESVAKVRNLGHPPRVLLPVRSATPIVAGAPVLADGVQVGQVTSVATSDGETAAIVRVRWSAASEPLATDRGPLSLLPEQ